jgi:hypothetical protein
MTRYRLWLPLWAWLLLWVVALPFYVGYGMLIVLWWVVYYMAWVPTAALFGLSFRAAQRSAGRFAEAHPVDGPDFAAARAQAEARLRAEPGRHRA